MRDSEAESVIGVVDSDMGSSKCDRGRRFDELKETEAETVIGVVDSDLGAQTEAESVIGVVDFMS